MRIVWSANLGDGVVRRPGASPDAAATIERVTSIQRKHVRAMTFLLIIGGVDGTAVMRDVRARSLGGGANRELAAAILARRGKRRHARA